MDVELRTHSSNPALTLRDLERWGDYPCAGWRASVVLTSGAFRATVRFYFDEAGLDTFVAALRDMDRALAGAATLATSNEEPAVTLEVARTGQVTVTGVLVDESVLPYQRLEFRFYTDQTCLGPFAADLAGARRVLAGAQPAA